MRLIVLALSLGTGITSLIHGVIEMRLSPEAAAQAAGAAAGTGFTWLTFALLGVSAAFAFFGGIMAFNRRRFGGILLLIAAAVCFFARPYFRVYGGIYLAGGVLAFFCRRASSYGNDEDEDFDDEYEDDEYEDDEYEDGAEDSGEDEFDEYAEEDGPERKGANAKNVRPPSAGKKPRRSALKVKENKEAYSVNPDRLSKLNEPVRLRSSKVCPACGASVGIEHKFCYFCGAALHTARPAEPDDAPAAPSPDLSDERENNARPESPAEAYSGPRGENFKEERPDSDEERPGGEESETFDDERAERDYDDREEEFDEEQSGPENEFSGEEDFIPIPRNAPEHVKISSPNKVFVKPVSNEDVIPKRPISINPDNSYQAFSNYTRRRKHRRHSFLRRIVGALVLLAAVGGAAWFLLGLRTVSEEDLPVPAEIPPIANSNDIAVPDGEPSPEEILAALRIDAPSRGIVTGSNVNVRPGHSTAGAIVTKLNQGERMEVIGQWQGVSGSLSGPWYQIRLNNREGWIYGQYFQPLDARPVTLPPGYTALLLKAFGSDRAELTSHLGPPTRETPTGLTWQGLTAAFRGDGEVTRLQVSSAKHVFQNGIAVGVTDEMLYKNVGYPSDYRSGQLLYLESPNQGVSVQLRNGKVQSITVGNI
jgi:hypothetical protein